ncbi:MAG: DUF5131 family protein [bacterium]|nr:DUF5131 family protein [bacterium]
MNRATMPTGWAQNPDGSPGYTWNPITGCLNHIGRMCKGGNFPCYAYGIAHRRCKNVYLANNNIAGMDVLPASETVSIMAEDPFYPRFWPEKLYHAWDDKPKGIFVCSMSDLFGIGVPEEWTKTVLNLCRLHTENRYYLLTKQPQNLAKFSPFPDNCWVGVTATTNGAMTNAYYGLANVEASVRFISFEPLLGSVGIIEHPNMKGWVDWVIIGAQSKPTRLPNTEWVREIIEAADSAGIPVFLKDNLNSENLPSNAFNKEGLVRREVPA